MLHRPLLQCSIGISGEIGVAAKEHYDCFFWHDYSDLIPDKGRTTGGKDFSEVSGYCTGISTVSERVGG